MGIFDTSVEPIVLSFFAVSDYFHEVLHTGIFFEVTKQFQQEQADRIIGTSQRFVCMRNNGPNKGEVYQGSDESGKPSGNTAVGMDFDVSSFVSIL